MIRLFALLSAFVGFSTAVVCAAKTEGASSPPAELRAAAQTFAITPKVGAPSAHTTTKQMFRAVYGDQKSTVMMFDDGKMRICFFTSPMAINGGPVMSAAREVIAKATGLPPEAIIINSSHNHSVPLLRVEGSDQSVKVPGEDQARALGTEYLDKLRLAAAGLAARLEPVKIEWGVAQEDRFTYNRRGRRPNGQMYFMREEDRQLMPADYTGLIDQDAAVVLLTGKKGPVGAIAFYTGHPVTAYKPENPISFGEWPQVAGEILSAHLGGVPVAFLQGCAGDINSKFLLTGTVEQSREFGGYLGESFIKAVASRKPSQRTDLRLQRQTVDIPLAPYPDQASLERSIAELDEFIRRCRAGDDDALYVVGLNYTRELSPPYRAIQMEGVRKWYTNALEIQKAGKTDEVPKALPLETVVARIGDIGFVGMPFESFVRTGLKIKHNTPLPFVLTCGYTDGGNGYIPDATACNDLDYMGGNYRYRIGRPPYRAPGADAMADAAIVILKDFAR